MSIIMLGKYPVLYVCRTVLTGRFDSHLAINNAFPPGQFDITTIFLHGTMNATETQNYYGKVIFWEIEKHKFFKQKFIYALRLLKLHLQHKFKLVICDQYKATAIVNILQKLHKIPRMYSIVCALDHYRKPKHRKFLEKQLIKSCKFITVSKAVKNSLLKFAPNLDPQRCVIIYNALDIVALEKAKLTRDQARKELNINNNDFIFATVGINYKNFCKAQDILIEAFTQIHHKMPKAKLLLIGGGDLEETIKQHVAAQHLENKIQVIGFLPYAARYFAAFDVLVLSSRMEACGLVLLEAMIHKLPIIATSAGGIPEVMGDTTKLIEPDDVSALAEQIYHLYSLTNLERQKLGAHIATRLDLFRIERLQRQYRELAF